jgi:small subunit ribosomal protein S8
MVSTDPIADMLTRIRNAIGVRKNEVVLPHSNVKETVAKILADNKFVSAVAVEPGTVQKQLRITINGEFENARITEIARLSRPGRRLYATADKIPVVKGGRGIVVISTSHGMMTGKEAKQKSLGGELICKVY